MRLKRKPPIWETPEWEDFPWEKKMEIWRRHRRYSIALGIAWLVTFAGSAVWWYTRHAPGGAGPRELGVVLFCAFLMGFFLWLGSRLIE